MDAEATELTVRACLAEARIRLDKAAGIARAAALSRGRGSAGDNTGTTQEKPVKPSNKQRIVLRA
jgi:hypothetical protein